MIWFLQRETDLLVCEIRHETSEYEFEVTGPDGTPVVHRFASATDLIDAYLRAEAALEAHGWRPRATDVALLE